MFYVKIAPPLSQQPPSKSWGPVKPPPFWKFGWRLNPPAERGEGGGGGNSHDGLSPPNHASQKIMLMSRSIIHDVPFKLEEAI